MKWIIRKPVLPIILLAILLSGTFLVMLLSYNMKSNRETVDRLYDETILKFRVLPGTNALSTLELPLNIADSISQIKEIDSTYCELHCPSVIGTPTGYFNFVETYGTSDMEAFAQAKKLEITYGEGYNAEVFRTDNTLCLLDESLVAACELNIGDTVSVAGCIIEYVLEDEAPILEFTLAGTYKSEEALLPAYATLVSDGCFFDKEGLLYSEDMEDSWLFYTDYICTINPLYNREYLRVQDEIKKQLGGSTNFLLYSNIRVLERSIRPLEQRLDTQRILFPLLKITIAGSYILLSIMMALNRRRDMLIRMVFGEKAGKVRISEWLYIILTMLVSAVPAVLLLVIIFLCDVPALDSLELISVSLVVAALGTLITMIFTSSGGLVKLYQSRNKGE